jgi:hypothetical protein
MSSRCSIAMKAAFQLTFVALVFAAGLSADSIVTVETGPGQQSPPCDPTVGCDPGFVYAYPADPSMGTLVSISWSMEVGQNILFDVDNCNEGAPPPLVNYSYSVTATVSALGQTSTPNTRSSSGQTYGGCAGMADFGYSYLAQLSGTITDLTPYLETPYGNSFVSISVTPYSEGYIDATPVTGGFVGSAYYTEIEGIILTMNYDYATPVPEPKNGLLVAVACGLLLVWNLPRAAS